MLRSISLYLGIFSILISFFSLLNIIYSQYLEFYLNLNSYLYTLIISFFLGIGFILYQSKKQNKINLYEKLLESEHKNIDKDLILSNNDFKLNLINKIYVSDSNYKIIYERAS